MGQIIGGAAKPKRCNLNTLGSVPTPAAGEYILVSSDNSMNAAGQGNFDCYIVGDGSHAATALELKNVETLIGVFDISSYHATGGVLAKYADLTAALNDGNNIPQPFRKGGMSVKFVQSSDNKYVQYRLMADEWSTTESDWQGVDDEPTAGSDNMVKSGGVSNCVNGIISLDRVMTIAAGSDNTFISYGPILEDTDAVVKISGTNGTFGFLNSGWTTLATYNFIDGEDTFVVIPKNTTIFRVYIDAAAQSALALNVLILTDGLRSNVVALKKKDAAFEENIGTINDNITALNTRTVPLLDYDKETVYKDYTNKISAGNYRLTSIPISPLQQQEYGYVLLKGLSGRVFFCDYPSWATLGSVDVVDNQIAPCIIPAGADYINVHTVDNIPVEVDTPFHLEIRYGTISNLLDKHENKLNALQEDMSNRATTEEVGIITPSVIKEANRSIASGSDNAWVNYTALSNDVYAKFLIKGISGTLKVYTIAYDTEKCSYAFTDGVAFQGFIPKNTSSFKVVIPSQASAKTDFNIRVTYNDVSGRLSGVESVWPIVNETVADYHRITCFDIQDKIAAGQYRCIKNTAMTALDTAVYGDLEYSGDTNPVIVSFLNPSYVVGAEYEVSGTSMMRILIPNGCRHIIVRTKDGQTVESDQTFSVKASYLTTDMRAAVENKIREEIADYNDNRYLPILQNLARTKKDPSTGTPSVSYKELVLQVITDIHDESNAANAFLAFNKKYSDYITDMVGVGDYQNGGLDNPLHIDSIDGWHDIIKAIGNHDAYENWATYGSSVVVDEQVCYETFLEGHIEDWGVIYQENKTYFYKDYDDAKVRVVFLDYMHWDRTDGDSDGQKAWLQNILYGDSVNSALAKEYHVLILRHCVPRSDNSGSFVPYANCTFVSLDMAAASDFISTEPDIVNEFMNQGGNFIAWLCGHAHVNWTGSYENYPNQTIIVQPCSAAFTYHRESSFDKNTDYVNQFNLYSFDTPQKRIKVYRVGAVYDRNMQHTESLTLSYDTTIENKVLNCF